MAIREVSYIPVTIRAACEKCGIEMRKEDVSYLNTITGRKKLSGQMYQGRFLYVCPNCLHEEQSDIDYPRIEYRRVKQK